MNTPKTVLVTGASGQLGRRLVRELLARGYSIRAHYRSPEKADKYCPQGVEPVIGDITEPLWMYGAVKGCDYVIHGAARVSIRPLSKADTEYMYRVNVIGTKHVIDACTLGDVQRLLHVSSVAAVGGSVNGRPLDEETEFNLAGYGLPYFETKREAEDFALGANGDSLEVVVVNPSIMVSPPDRKLTEKDLRKIPKRIPVYFDFGINLVETADVIDGIIGALEKGRPGQRYILAADNLNPSKAFELANKFLGIKKPLIKIPYWGLYLLACISELIYLFKKKKPKLNRNVVRLVGLKLYYSSEKAQRELGYTPKPLAETLAGILKKVKFVRDTHNKRK
ncbi:MAG: NAD-dependent epimerase/dehydratase family protein [candidate division Zixibacteria bacterium]|nr:NAD-dependent epimerase/dehydratase family protein [candidate division Zixibacteria bacterium]